jgi:hypothetical protein
MKIKGLTIIATFFIGLLIWINFIDFKFEEIIKGTAAKSEYLIETISLSYLAAYIFYVLNIYLVERRERKSILPFVAKKVIGIIVNNHSIINCITEPSKINKNLDYYPTQDDYKQKLKLINPKENVPLFFKTKSWIFLFKNRQESTQNSIDRIWLSGKHIDEELRRILLEISCSLYFKENYAFNSEDFEDENLEKYHLVFFKYFQLIQQLKNYYDKNLKEYYLQTLPKQLRK